VYSVRDLKVYYKVIWERLNDPGADRLTYTYQVARDPAFSQLLVHGYTGGLTEYKVTEKEWYDRLGDAPENQVVTPYPQYDPERPHLGGYEVWPGGRADIFVHPVLALNLNPTCSQNPAVTRRWRVQNPNRFAVDVRWVVKGTVHSGTFAAPPGESFFTTPAVAGTNLVALEWVDQYGTVRRKEKAASSETCSGRTGGTMRTEADLLFPNPARDKAVLRLAHPAGTLVDLVLTDGVSGRVV
jgi:hypothetical protein